MTQITTQSGFETTIHGLNELLRGELAAVETYTQALSQVGMDSVARTDLLECQASHARRVWRLRAQILERGREPDQGSGPWGLFAKAVQGSATIGGSKLAITALEAGEDHGMKKYKEILPRLDSRARAVVSGDFYRQQMRTHDLLSMLKRRLWEAPRARAI